MRASRNLIRKRIMLDTKKVKDMYYLLRKEVVPALGCTEPIAVALAVAKAAETWRGCAGKGKEALPDKLKIQVSLNIYKNGMGVGIPGTDMTGLYIASALGAIVGDSKKELEVLAGVRPEHVEMARKYVEEGRISIDIKKDCNKVYAESVCEGAGHQSRAVIEAEHQNIVLVEADGKCLFSKQGGGAEAQAEEDAYNITMDEIYEFASTQPFEDIS